MEKAESTTTAGYPTLTPPPVFKPTGDDKWAAKMMFLLGMFVVLYIVLANTMWR